MQENIIFKGDVLGQIKSVPRQFFSEKTTEEENNFRIANENLPKSISELKANLNIMIKTVLRQKENYFGSSSDQIALIKNCVGIISDIHGDLFSLLSSLYCMGAITLQENDFIFYNADKNTYYTQQEYENSEDAADYNAMLKDINSLYTQLSNYYSYVLSISLSDKSEEDIEPFCVEWKDRKKDEYVIKEDSVAIKSLKYEHNCYISNKSKPEKKMLLEDFIKEIQNKMDTFYVFPTPHLNPNFKGRFINLGDYIDRGFESMECLCISELLGMANLNIINCIGNHEAMSIGIKDKIFYNFVKRGIKNGTFTTGKLIDTGRINENEQHIYESFSHTILCKGHLYKLFSIVKNLIVDKGKIADVDFFCEWESELNKLDTTLKEKLLAVDFSDELFNTPTDPNKFYDSLIQLGFEDKDFFEIKIAVGNTIFGELYNRIDFTQNGFEAIVDCDESYKLDFIFGERYWPKSKDEVFLNINQNVGHDASEFITISDQFNVTRHDAFRSVGYRANSSKVCVLVKDITATNEIFLFTNTLELIYRHQAQKINFANEILGFTDDDFEKAILKNYKQIITHQAKETNKASFHVKKQTDEFKKFVSKGRMKRFFNIDLELWQQICKNKSKYNDQDNEQDNEQNKEIKKKNSKTHCQIY